jgi:predicted CoA-binding protein
MQMHTLDHRGYEIVVQPERNELGAWHAKVSVRYTVDTVAQFRPETVQPEWLTEAEAVRDGIEWATRLIDHKLAASPNEG